MTREELKFRANKIAETGLSGSVLELLIIGLAEEYAMEPPLQQTDVRRSLPQGNVAILTTALRHVAQWSDKEEDMWDDPGYCAIEALENYEASKRQ